MLLRPLLRVAAVLLLPTLFTAEAGRYAASTTTSLIPFNEGSTYDWTDRPHVNLRFSANVAGTSISSQIPFVVDTGSCGIMTRKSNLAVTATEWASAVSGQQYFTSSHFLYVGKWVWRYVWFNRGSASEIKSYVPVLAIQTRYHCTTYDLDTHPASCTADETVDEASLTTTYMGIGYGRTYDGQPDGVPAKNPLLNIVSMASGGTAWNSTFWYGYIISKSGITVGLTDTNWGSMASLETRLRHDPHVAEWMGMPKRHYPWGEMQGTVSIAGSQQASGTVMLDTGMEADHASIRVPATVISGVTRDSTDRLANGQRVQVRLGIPERVLLEHTTGAPPTGSPDPACGTQPDFSNAYSRPTTTFTNAFVNTGRHIYRQYRVGYDPVTGYSGFESVDSDPCTP